MIYTRIPIYNFYVRNYHSFMNLLQSFYSLCGVTFSWWITQHWVNTTPHSTEQMMVPYNVGSIQGSNEMFAVHGFVANLV